MNVKEGDLILCTVKKIEGTTVFVTIPDGKEASIGFSEVAAGRIRNIREYATPGKKIVCKVLETSDNRIELSLRRVTGKERDYVLEKNKKENNLKSMLKAITPNSQQIIEKIQSEQDLVELVEDAKENPKLLEKYFSKEETTKLLSLLEEKGEKAKTVNKKFTLTTTSESGLKDLKEILDSKEIEISYLGSSKYSASASGKNFKEANMKLESALQEISKKAKQKLAQIEIPEK